MMRNYPRSELWILAFARMTVLRDGRRGFEMDAGECRRSAPLNSLHSRVDPRIESENGHGESGDW
ncbi:MAG: hypothetical protein ACKVP5_05105, partial [Aestuariivirga sp.]